MVQAAVSYFLVSHLHLRFEQSSLRSSCKLCDEGTFSATAGLSENQCANCDEGRFANSTGLSKCFDCAPGTARVAPGGSICAQCDRGHFSNESRAAVCIDCPEGRFAEDLGSSECEPCSPGWFEQSTGASVCDVCGETNFNPDPGQDTCTPCQQGLFGPVGNDTLTACLNCTVGRRGTADGQNECPACAQGRFNDVEGLAIECKACARGRYAATIGLSVCTNCLRGQYSTQPAATAASFCQNCSIARFVFSTRCGVCGRGQWVASCLTLPASTLTVPCTTLLSPQVFKQRRCNHLHRLPTRLLWHRCQTVRVQKLCRWLVSG